MEIIDGIIVENDLNEEAHNNVSSSPRYISQGLTHNDNCCCQTLEKKLMETESSLRVLLQKNDLLQTENTKLKERIKELEACQPKKFKDKFIGVFSRKKKETYSEIQEKPSGLSNWTGTCYMNAMVQALASSSKFIDQLDELSHRVDQKDMLTKFIVLLKGLNHPSLTNECSRKLIEFMNIAQWNRKSQQDSFQLLTFFINSIHKDIGINSFEMPPKLKILHTFTEDCTFNSVQNHLALSLPLCGRFRDESGVDIYDLMNSFFEASSIEDSEHKTAMYLFEKAPDVMLLHIQANERRSCDGHFVKPRYYINYEPELQYVFNIQKSIDGSKMESVGTIYQLVAVVEHIGSIGSGHYIAYRKCAQKWYKVNDRTVTSVYFKFNIVPYIMVYEKVSETV